MSDLPDFEAWAIFARVADLGSFARAAQDLKLAKPTVSKAIARLEARLGVALLHRTSRQMGLTENGRSALARARHILAEGVKIEAELSAQVDMPRGLVRMTAPMSFGIQQLGPLLPEFLETYPEVSIDLNLSDAHEDLIVNGYDLALRVARLADSSLRARKLCDVRRPFVASPRYIERYGRPLHPRDLFMHKTILHSTVPSPEIWRLQHPIHGEWDGRIGSRLISNNLDVVIPVLVEGHAIAVQPIFSIWQELQQGQLEEILPGWSLAPVSLYLVTPPSALRPSRVTVLMDFLSARLTTQQWNTVFGG